MSVKEHVLQKAQPYIQALSKFFNYQIVTKAILSVWLFLLGRIFNILLKSSGRVAVTSGDWKFLFTTY
jgi:glycerophosphoryl diester phosphodiesterase